MPTYLDFFGDLRARLQPLYDAEEAAAIAKLFLENATGFSYTQALARNPEIPMVTAKMIDEATTQLAKGKPVQHVLGRTRFLGRSFRCDARALIPRPETEELVSWILEDFSGNTGLQILDVGTGTGCIAVSLALELPGAAVTALDLSPDALALARINAEALGASVIFRQGDFLSGNRELFSPQTFDVIVSNPPYIPQKEAENLHRNVRDYEPHLALFVPDKDVLIFYRALAEAKGLLKEGSAVYCETHRDLAEETAALFWEAGFRNVEVREDIFGAPRMVRAGL